MSKKCKHCKNGGITNFGRSKYSETHIYCPKCGSHFYNNRWWTKVDWNAYVNDIWKYKVFDKDSLNN